MEDVNHKENLAQFLREQQYPIDPALFDVLLVSHSCDVDENGLFSGPGSLEFRNGHRYEGMLDHGTMHGHGMFTWFDGVVYEGEMQNNTISGRGKYRWPNGTVYEGQVVFGKREGEGELTMKGVVYRGQWKGGLRHGKGTITFADGSVYEGEWVNDNREGMGTMKYASGNVYTGQWLNNLRHGSGRMEWTSLGEIYDGQWAEGKQEGKGEHVWLLMKVENAPWQNYNRYRGQWHHGMRDGFGTFEYADGSRYEGEWKNNQKHGQGTFFFVNDTKYEGRFVRDRMLDYKPPAPSAIQNTAADIVLAIDDLLRDTDDAAMEMARIRNVLLNHLSDLKKMYRYYSRLDNRPNPQGQDGAMDGNKLDNAFAMSMLEFWKFSKDSKLPDHNLTLAAIDRIFLLVDRKGPPPLSADIHNPERELVFREFLEGLVRMADLKMQHVMTLAGRVEQCLDNYVIPHAMKDEADNFRELLWGHSEVTEALGAREQALRTLYGTYASVRHQHGEKVMSMRDFLLFCKLNQLIDTKLTHSAVLDIFLRVNMDDGTYLESNATNLDLELIFPEFLEGLARIALQREGVDILTEEAVDAEQIVSVVVGLVDKICSTDQKKLMAAYNTARPIR